MLEAAAELDYDIILTGDSDMILHPLWFARLVKFMPKTHGVLSLYNSCSHKLIYCGEGMCARKDVGNAGCAFTRERLRELMAKVPREQYVSSVRPFPLPRKCAHLWQQACDESDMRLAPL